MKTQKTGTPLSEAIYEEEVHETMKDSLLFQFHKIHSAMFKIANQMIQASSVPIKIEQLPVLMCIYYHQAITQQAIAERIKRDKSSVLRTLATLGRKGLIEIVKDKEDRRKKIVRATSTGIFLAVQIKDIMQKIENEIAKTFNSENKEELVKTLRITAQKLELLPLG